MTIASVLLALLTATSSPEGKPTGPVLLDFHAEWCGPCRKARPAVEQLIRDGYAIKTIDIDQEPALAQRYNVKAVPTFIVVDRSGRELDRTAGLQSAAQLAQFYKTATPKAQPPARNDSSDWQQNQPSGQFGSQNSKPSSDANKSWAQGRGTDDTSRDRRRDTPRGPRAMPSEDPRSPHATRGENQQSTQDRPRQGQDRTSSNSQNHRQDQRQPQADQGSQSPQTNQPGQSQTRDQGPGNDR
jgi:thiol-disulfide isomerase/thioredoxin